MRAPRLTRTCPVVGVEAFLGSQLAAAEYRRGAHGCSGKSSPTAGGAAMREHRQCGFPTMKDRK